MRILYIYAKYDHRNVIISTFPILPQSLLFLYIILPSNAFLLNNAPNSVNAALHGSITHWSMGNLPVAISFMKIIYGNTWPPASNLCIAPNSCFPFTITHVWNQEQNFILHIKLKFSLHRLYRLHESHCSPRKVSVNMLRGISECSACSLNPHLFPYAFKCILTGVNTWERTGQGRAKKENSQNFWRLALQSPNQTALVHNYWF